MTRLLKISLLISLCFFSSHCASQRPIANPFEEPTAPSRSSEASSNLSGSLKILAIDVGQGDATLVIGPEGKTLLIDGGPPEAGIQDVIPTITNQGIDHLDWMVATHYDADHISGIAEILLGEDQLPDTDDDLIPTFAILDHGNSTDKSTQTYKSYLHNTDSFREEATPGMRIDLGSGAYAEVIVVNGDYKDGRSIHLNPDEENGACIGLLIHYGNFNYFTAGDLSGGGSPGGYETKDLESIAGEIIGDIDILHAGHHGSASSTNANLLRETTPENVIISVGKDNDYGHPAASTLSRIQSIGAAIYRTDLLGTIEIQTDGHQYEILTPDHLQE